MYEASLFIAWVDLTDSTIRIYKRKKELTPVLQSESGTATKSRKIMCSDTQVKRSCDST